MSANRRDRKTAAIFAFMLGGLGAHWFYLGRQARGVICVIFVWTFIPLIVGLIRGTQFLMMSDKEFQKEYGNGITINEPSVTYLDELTKLADLKEKGVLTEEEFQSRKKELLENN